MSDGERLQVEISYPTELQSGLRAKGPFPVLLTRDPYQGAPVGLLQTAAGTASGNSAFGAYYAQHGYIFVHENIRGSGGRAGFGASDGSAQLFDPRSRLDGLEMAYWAADPRNLAHSDGRVGLHGCSALGISQQASLTELGRRIRSHERVYVPGPTTTDEGKEVDATLKTNPIKVAIPACNNGDFYRDTLFDGGIPGLTWDLFPLQQVFGAVNFSNPTANTMAHQYLIDVLAGGDMAYDRQWYRDRNWVRQADDLARTGVPLLMWLGSEEPGTVGSPQLYAALQNAAQGRDIRLPMDPNAQVSPKYQMIMGDWGHGGGLDDGIQLEWYETWLKGVDTGLQTTNRPLHFKELPSGPGARWINMSSYPMTTSPNAYYLGAGGTASERPLSASSSVTLPWAPQISTSWDLTAALTKDVTFWGPSAVKVWASTTGTNLQLAAALVDVAPDGSTTEITHGSALASRRHLDTSRSWKTKSGLPLAPYLSLQDDQFVKPGEDVEFQFPLQPRIWRLKTGHLLRLVLRTQFPTQDCTKAAIGRPGGCEWTVPMLRTLPGVYTIKFGGKYPAVVTVPLAPSSTLKTARAGVTPTSGGVVLPQDWR